MDDPTHPTPARGQIAVQVSFVLAAAIFFVGAIAALTLSKGTPQAGDPIALIYPPQWSAQESFAATLSLDVDILTLGRADFIVIAAPKEGSDASTFRRSGALVVLNAIGAQICAPRSPNQDTKI